MPGLEGELLVGERLEAQPVQRRDAEALDRLAVLGGRVADVGVEAPARVLVVGAAHVAVARDLGDDRRRGDRGALRVAVDDRLQRRSGKSLPSGKPSDRHMTPGQATRRSASRSAARFVRCSPRWSIPRGQRETTLTFAAVRSTIG